MRQILQWIQLLWWISSGFGARMVSTVEEPAFQAGVNSIPRRNAALKGRSSTVLQTT
jgi:hypothetical protein